VVMLTNERQYRSTQAHVRRFEELLRRLTDGSGRVDDVDPRLRQAEISAVSRMPSRLRAQLRREYRGLRSGRKSRVRVDFIENLPRTLIAARISSGMTAAELARRVGATERPIERYEATEYAGASLARIQEIAQVINGEPSENGPTRTNSTAAKGHRAPRPVRRARRSVARRKPVAVR